MTVVLDTGPLVAALHLGDPLRPRALELLGQVWRGKFGVPVAPDTVLDEGLTLLRRRPGRADVSRAFCDYFLPEAGTPPLLLRTTTSDLLKRAADLHFRFYDRALSFTDCTLLAHVEATGGVLATFDGGFAGLCPLAAATPERSE